MFVGKNWDNIAEGNTAFIIAGGPSSKNIEDKKKHIMELVRYNIKIAK